MVFKSRFRTASILLLVMGQLALAEVADALVPKQDDGLLESLTFVSEALQASARIRGYRRRPDDGRRRDRQHLGQLPCELWRLERRRRQAHRQDRGRRGRRHSFRARPWQPAPDEGHLRRSRDDREVDLARMEGITRAFLPRVAGLLGVDPSTLILNQGRSGHPGDYLWFVDFDVVHDGMAVEGARVVFRVNNGNLIQFGSENLPAEGIKPPRRK